MTEGLQQDEALEALQVIIKDGVIDHFNLNVGRSDTDYMLASHPVPAMFVGLAPFVQLAGLFKSTQIRQPSMQRVFRVATARYAVA